MAVVPVVDFLESPEPLRRKARAVTREEFDRQDRRVLSLAIDLVETMLAANGAGLASVQVHPGEEEPLRAYALRATFGPVVVFNPVARFDARQEWAQEGCLSFRSVRRMLRAPIAAEVSGVDEYGQPVSLRLRGLGARCAYHEGRHLDGLLMIDLMKAPEREKFLRAVGRVKRG